MIAMQAVILAAGESTRFWPLSEGRHKSLIKVMGKPLVQWTIEAVKKAGINDIIIVQSPNGDIEKALDGKIAVDLNIKYVTQHEPKGMGNALLCAEPYITKDFFVLLPYHFEAHKHINDMMAKYKQDKADAVLCGAKTSTPWRYGIMSIDGDRITGLIEKPVKGSEPSDIKVSGIYLLPKDFFNFYSRVERHNNDYEDALALMIKECDVQAIIAERETPTLKYSWDFMLLSDSILRSRIKGKNISPTASIDSNVIIEGDVWIGDGTKIFDGAIIKGPCYIGNNCIIGNHSLVRGSIIEDNCIIGAHAEVARCFFQRDVHTHSGYFGDSVFDEGVRIGAGTITANRRIDRNTIRSVIKGERIDSNLNSLGAIIGRGSRLGVHVSLMPGVLIGSNVIVGPHTMVTKNIESNTIFYTKHEIVKKKKKHVR